MVALRFGQLRIVIIIAIIIIIIIIIIIAIAIAIAIIIAVADLEGAVPARAAQPAAVRIASHALDRDR